MTQIKRTAQDWFTLIEECRVSGIAVKDFCAIKGIHPSNFYYWVKRQRTTHGQAFVPVMIAKQDAQKLSQQMVEIVYPNGVSLRLSSEIDIRLLSQLIRL